MKTWKSKEKRKTRNEKKRRKDKIKWKSYTLHGRRPDIPEQPLQKKWSSIEVDDTSWLKRQRKTSRPYRNRRMRWHVRLDQCPLTVSIIIGFNWPNADVEERAKERAEEGCKLTDSLTQESRNSVREINGPCIN
jgi:hypothetical protein